MVFADSFPVRAFQQHPDGAQDQGRALAHALVWSTGGKNVPRSVHEATTLHGTGPS